MDQVKVGVFIAELRREQDMTQRQLAESIGVSDKTISKWECGNGLPELSTIPELCRVLHVNMNELLSGERLEEEVYSIKAEENMMTLMKETEEHKKKNSMVTLIVCLIGVAAVLITAVTFGVGTSAFVNFIDTPSLLMLLIPTSLILAAAGLLKSFFRAFSLLGKGKDRYEETQWKKAKSALCLGARTLLAVGSVETIAAFILLLGNYQHSWSVERLFANVAVALITVLYALVGYLFLLPIRHKLNCMIEENEIA